jgi:hypothetical protein
MAPMPRRLAESIENQDCQSIFPNAERFLLARIDRYQEEGNVPTRAEAALGEA